MLRRGQRFREGVPKLPYPTWGYNEDMPVKPARLFASCVVIRYSDESFFSVADLSLAQAMQQHVYSWSAPLTTYNMSSASGTRSKLMIRLMARAGKDAMRVFRGTQRYNEKDPLVATSGVAQCTRDLPPSECTRCLSYYTDQLPQLLSNNSIGGSVTGFSCHLAYNTYTINKNGRRKRIEVVVVAGLVTGVVALMLCLISLSIWFLSRQRQRRSEAAARSELEQPPKEMVHLCGRSIDQDELEQGTGPVRFSYGELVATTDCFSDSNKLGEGGFEPAYRGFLHDTNLDIAVKKMSKSSRQGRKGFISEVRIINQIQHQNLMQLVG
uniref:Uncharacterized protein n=1 Tax=Hordeum vulgare subsp. vulgare TaxID=112509 RepID=A0A8I6X832_HORVV